MSFGLYNYKRSSKCWPLASRLGSQRSATWTLVEATFMRVTLSIWLNFKIYMCRSNFKYLCKFFLFPMCVNIILSNSVLYIYFSNLLFSLPFIRASSAVAFLVFAILIVILRGFFFFFWLCMLQTQHLSPRKQRFEPSRGDLWVAATVLWT